jgi:WD40 repeat protein
MDIGSCDPMSRTSQPALILALFFLFSACSPLGAAGTGTIRSSPNTPGYTLTPSPYYTPTPSPYYTPTKTKTHTPSPTATPTPAFPPLPAGLAVITLNNASRIAQLSRIGNGVPSDISWSPDGKVFAISSSLGINLYDAQTLQEILFIKTGNYAEIIHFSSDRTVIFSGSSGDGIIESWRVSDGALLRTIETHQSEIHSMAFSPDGTMLAFGTKTAVILWRVSDGTYLRKWEIDQWEIEIVSIAFSPDGTTLITGGWWGGVKLWRVLDGTQLYELKGELMGSVYRVAFSPDGQFVAAGSIGGIVNLWRAADGAHLSTMQSTESMEHGGVRSLLFLPDGNTLVAAYSEGGIILWRIPDGTILRTLQEATYDWSCLEFSAGSVLAVSPDGRILATQSCAISFWRLSDGERISKMEGNSISFTSAALSPNGETLAAGTGSGRVYRWRLSDGRVLSTFEGAGFNNGLGTLVYFSPDGETLAVLHIDNSVDLWKYTDEVFIRTLEISDTRSAAFSPDGTMLATGGWDFSITRESAIIFWRISNGERLSTLEVSETMPMSVAFSPDGNLLAAGMENSTLTLWRVSDGEWVNTWGIPPSEFNPDDVVVSVAFSPDGTLIAASTRMEARLYRTSDGALIRKLDIGNYGQNLAFSPDGTILASAAGDIRLWRVSDGSLLTKLSGHTAVVSSVFFSPDGTFLGSASYDGTIRFWGIA